MQRSETSLLAPFRACGLICSEIKPTYQALNSPYTGEICCAIDNVICIYTIKPFRLRTVTNSLNENITILTRNVDFMFAAAGKSIYVYNLKEHNLIKQFTLNNTPNLLLSCGESTFMVIDDNNKIFVYDFKEDECLSEIELPQSFNATAIVHPLTYINQIMLGGEDGRMRLMDIEKAILIKEYESDKNFNCKINVLEQSTAKSILGVGLNDGRIHLRNIEDGSVLFSFRHEGSITALSFRSDDIETLISGSTDGSIAIWNLDKQILVGQKFNAHNSFIVSLNFLLGEAYFISSGKDNKLIKWVLKDEFAMPEEVKVIEGPSKPLTSISFVGSKSILTASEDGRVRQFYSFHHDNTLKSLGIAREVKKNELSRDRFIDVRMSSIMELQTVSTKESIWDDVICRHKNSPLVSSWSTRRCTRGSLLLYHKRFKNNPKYLAAYVTTIFLSSCGTFALIGYSSGHLDVFNMQSGKHRCSFSYPSNKKKTNDEDDDRAHLNGAITGVAMDMLNHTVVSGASDSSIHFWSFNPPKLLSRISNSSCKGVTKFHLNRTNSLLAVAFDNGDLVIVDILFKKVARRFKNAHNNKITALEYSPDGKWLISTDVDCMLKIWDLATSNLIDVMRCSIACVGISFNETGEYLATIHENQRAVFIWANKTLFLPNFNQISLTNSYNENCKRITQLPIISIPKLDYFVDYNKDESDDDNQNEVVQVVVIDEEDEEMTDTNLDLRNLNDTELITLSGLPSSRWANLPHLSLIKERNKPIEPPKKPVNAPFFLPGVENLDGFSFSKGEEENNDDKMLVDDKENISKILLAQRANSIETIWFTKLKKAYEENNTEMLINCFNKLKSMNVSAIDFEIRSLTHNFFSAFLIMLLKVLEKKTNFELIQSYLATFLNIHSQSLWSLEDLKAKNSSNEDNCSLSIKTNDNLDEILKKLLDLQKDTWNQTQFLIDSNTSVAQWIKSAVI